VDLRAAVGKPVKATSRGLVRFAGQMIVEGRNVILDHGEGIFSRYMHLSRILVKEGEWVNAGDVVGLAGSSGRAEAPHLHWELIWKGHYADPLALIESWRGLCRKPQLKAQL
jgi:murein DD-endopeptidase MepM/ murein hydrolase activator NlpD